MIRENAITQLRDLKQHVDSVLEYFECGGVIVVDEHAQPMAYDIILGGRFGIVDIKERDRLETEWRGKKVYKRTRLKPLAGYFATEQI